MLILHFRLRWNIGSHSAILTSILPFDGPNTYCCTSGHKLQTRLVSSSTSTINHCPDNVTNSLDIPHEILLIICRYMTPCDVLRSFYTPTTRQSHIHRLIATYYTKIKLDTDTFEDCGYLFKLLLDSNHPLRPASLTLT
ncbi:unnamed protein product [Rotaria magnacalcarata]|uniref:F-box domain-containing protein n=1 Tax=Rotaria magnacalcarata TaxID=392030 RepID=A0A8S2ZWW3_9BILA|nr:unnamed protein product [Rotaria magnacalcarata]CAF4683426.1 unnamed protein product [Rotaria magnacalcarata]CAF5190010.1 unnamed protein product [Rotaria magnacalcarata]